jgi:uncharacterized protein (DUF433 family)
MTPSGRRPKAAQDARNGVKRRRGEAKVLTTLRLRRALRDDLVAAAERSRRSLADVAQELLEEGLRMRLCPGIYFADEPSGRTAKVGGTGLGVWEVLSDFCRDNDLDSLRQAFSHLSQAQLTAALMYYRRYPEEIRRQVEANARLTPDVIEKEFPGLVRFISAG